jgi:Starch-binding associating with outer membrane
MTIKIINRLLTVGILTAGLTFSSCADFLDVNTNPNQLADAPFTTQLPGTFVAAGSAHYGSAFSINQITQHLAGAGAGGTDSHNEIRLGGTWTSVYLNGMTNLYDIVKKADAAKSPYYSGVAKVMIALNLGLATDIWGDVPYSEAISLEKQFYPKFDSQQEIYQKLPLLLDEAIANLNATTSAFAPAKDDLAYAGNRAKWVKLANALKARFAIHLTKKTGKGAADAALAALAGGMTDNTDDLQVVYATNSLNPWHSGVALANVTGNLTVRHAEQLADAMNGATFGVWDPRLPVIAGVRGTTINTWKGNVSGEGTGGVLDLLITSWHSTPIAPILMMTFSEQKFIEAEARFISNGGTQASTGSTAEAYAAYLAGIKANLDKLGVADTAKTRYLADPKVAVGAANLQLTHIMGEKWKALFLQPEAWTDMRRYDYLPAIYKDLALPFRHNPSLAGQWIRRAQYPTDEFSRNSEQVRKVAKNLQDKVWWDEK